LDRLRSLLAAADPPLAWTLRSYRRTWLRGDAVAGVTVAALIVPLSIGYAQVAGLPPEAGLYASLVPLIAYAIFGSARRLIVGPDAATAALVAAAIVPLAVATDDRVRLAAALALLVAVVFVAMRIAALGFLADFLSRPILVGYMTGVGLSVAIGQVPKLLGGSPLADVLGVIGGTDIGAVGSGAVLEAVGIALAQSTVNLPSIVVGLLVFGAIMAGDRYLPGVPIALPSLIAALVASVVLDLPGRGVLILGPIPGGLPPIGLPLVSVDEAIALLPGAIGIAVLSFADTALTGRSFSGRHGETTDPDRELVALAAADLGASLTSGYPVSSSPSRTAAAEAAGATTQLAGIIAAGTVAIVLLFLTGPLANLPIPALGAVILASALRYIDIAGVRRIWRLERVEGAIAIAAVAGVLLYGTLAGVGVAAGLAALNVFRRAAQPRIDELGQVESSDVFAALSREPAARRLPGLLVVRFAGPLFFATSTPFVARIRSLLVERPDVRRVVIDAAPIVDIDVSAADALAGLQRDLERRGIDLTLARPTGALRDLLRGFGLAELAGSAEDARRSVARTVEDGGYGDGSAAGEDRPWTAPDVLPDAASDAASDTAAQPDPDRPVAAGEPPPRRWSIGLLVLGSVAVAALAGALVLGGSDQRPPTAGITMPNLIGLPLDRARATIDGLGLVLGETSYVQTTSLPEGTVVTQEPKSGTSVDAGAAVDIAVSSGLELVVVPDVVGQTEAQAIVSLTGVGLRVAGTDRATSTDIPAGVVVAVDPAAGREVAVGTPARIVVSSGPAEPAPSATPAPTRTPAVTPAPTPSIPATPQPSAPSEGPPSLAPTAPASDPAASATGPIGSGRQITRTG
jgi:high affinity sulfate transporter 1